MHAGAIRRLAKLLGASMTWATVAGASLCFGWQADASRKLRGAPRPSAKASQPTLARSEAPRIELQEPSPRTTRTASSVPSPQAQSRPNLGKPRKSVGSPDSAAAKSVKNNPSDESDFRLTWDAVESFGERISNVITGGGTPPRPASNADPAETDKRVVTRETIRRRNAAEAMPSSDAPPRVMLGASPVGIAVASDREESSRAPTAGPSRPSLPDEPPTVAEQVTLPESTVAIASDDPASTSPVVQHEAPSAVAPLAGTATELGEAPDTRVARAPIEIAPAYVKDIQPGTTTLAELTQAWGAPCQIAENEGRIEHFYQLAPFDLVVVTLIDGRVSSIFISLREPIAAELAATELGLTGIEPVTVPDEFGVPLGIAYPERGVLFSFDPECPEQLVSRIIVETIHAEPFVRRGEAQVQVNYQVALNDLNAALQLDPTQHRAHWLRAQLFSDAGRELEALVAIDAALELAPHEAEYLLTKSKLLSLTGKYDEALVECDAVLGLAKLPVDTEARVWLLKGDLLAAGPDRDYKRAMELHVQAIKLARPLVEDPKVTVRRAAQEVLVAAHLAVARDIAWGSWNHKEDVVPKWIAQADEIAAAAIRRGDAPGDFHFRICQQALAAYVGMQGAADPTYWTEETVKSGKALLEQASDPWYRRRLEWELGMTLYDAVQVFHMRREYEQALEYGPLAVQFLRAAESDRQDLPGHGYLMGRLYFRLGAIHLAHDKDHSKAIPWFKQAVPLMEQPIPASAMADVGRQGETLVSMAVSFWETGDHDQALRLTTRGVELMERAVDQGILHPEALAIGYSNLASMHSDLGHPDEARTYDELAARSELQLHR